MWLLVALAAGRLRAGAASEAEAWDAAQVLAALQEEGALHLEEVQDANSTDGVHVCSCVDPVHDEPRQDLRSIRWLHAPKTGTSFWSTLFSYACRAKGPMDLNVSPYFSPSCVHCYDFAVKERYPPQEFCAAGSFALLETQHPPLTSPPENAVAFFRHPSERLLSAFVNHHASGFSPANMQALTQKCYGPQPNPHCFAQYPGVKGCMARMLTGGMCADEGAAQGHPFPANVQQAIAIVQRLGFIGLTEEWNDSVCLFHKMFGGKVQQAEFKNFHPSVHAKPEVHLADELDQPVYAAAKARFRALLKEHGAERCYQRVPTAPRCLPRTCQQAGAECAPMADGCGGVLQCGHCPQHRVGPSTCRAATHTCHAAQVAPVGGFNVSTYRAGYLKH